MGRTLRRRRDRFEEAVDFGLQAGGGVGQLPHRAQQLPGGRAGLVGAVADLGDGASDLGGAGGGALDVAGDFRGRGACCSIADEIANEISEILPMVELIILIEPTASWVAVC